MSQIPRDFQDYDEDDPQINRRAKRWDYWVALKKIRIEYLADCAALSHQFDAYDFEGYVEANYGIKMNLVDGNITDGYEITDEKKYIIFVLKYQ